MNREFQPIDTLIRELWEKTSGEETGENFYPEDVGEFLSDFQLNNNKHALPKVDNNILLLDQLISWLFLSWLSLDTTATTKENKAYRVVFGALCSHVTAIRNLVLLGFDVQAKQVLRCLAETADLLALLVVSPQLCGPFVDAQDPEDANRFWHQHLSKGKTRRKFRNILYSADDDAKLLSAIDEFEEYRQQEESILGMSIHPSYLGCALSVVPAGSHPKIEHFGMFGVRTEASIRTIRYTLFSFSHILASGFPFLTTKLNRLRKGPIVTFDDESKLHKASRAGNNVLLEILFLICQWQKSNPHLEGEFGSYPYEFKS